ncbi:MAG: ABC transporter ATP-binding protein/permease [Bacilli bacterium]|jgi:ABC-type lipoprotein export system ATPase subunit
MSLINLINVSKSFKRDGKDNFLALKNINLSFDRQGLVFIKGKSGSGKSTLLNIIAHIEKPTQGMVEFDAKNLFSFNKKQLCEYRSKQIAVVFQHYNLIERCSSLFNVMLPLLIYGVQMKEAQEKVMKLFKRFGMEAFSNKTVDSLSGGEKQRLGIIRALSNSPMVLLCDEPTGALDKHNSEIVMDALREISKTRLVIIVSHNSELMKNYADRMITLKDGAVVEDSSPLLSSRQAIVGAITKKKKNSRWKYFFVRKNLKTDLKQNLLCSFVCMIGFSSLLLSAGFYHGSAEAIKEYQKKSLEYSFSIIQKKEYQSIEGSPLNLVKTTRPNIDEVYFLNDYSSTISVELSFNYLLSEYSDVSYDQQIITNSRLVPVFDISLENYQKKLIVVGSPPYDNDLRTIIVNKEFAELNFASAENAVGKRISISNDVDINYPVIDSERQYIKDCFSLKIEAEIVAVVDEFSFLNHPKIYYSYVALRDLMINYPLDEIGAYLQKRFTCYDLVEQSPSNSAFSGYCYNLFVHDEKESENIFFLANKLVKNESAITIQSTPNETKQAYDSLVMSFSLSMMIFVLISFVGIILIIGIISYSSFIKKKKESAILSCLGATDSDVSDIFVLENVIISLISALVSMVISFPLSNLFNHLLSSSFGINNIISIPLSSFLNIPLLIPSCVCILGIVVSYFCSVIPLKSYKAFSLSSELRDE